MTQPTRGGAVTTVWQTLCKLCRPFLPQQWGPITIFLARVGRQQLYNIHFETIMDVHNLQIT